MQMNPQMCETSYLITPVGVVAEPERELHGWKDNFPPNLHRKFEDRLDELNETWQVAEDHLTGRKFEIGVVNQHNIDENATLFTSTSFSSLTHNAGNAIELAAHGAAIPEAARIYVAFPGSGGSSALSRSERTQLARTGRFTEGSGTKNDPFRPMEVLQALNRLLEAKGYIPNRVSADVEGARLAIGMLTVFERGAVRAAFLNGVPGVSRGPRYVQGMVEEDYSSNQKLSIYDQDSWAVTSEFKHEVKQRLPRIYRGAGHAALMSATYNPFRALPTARAAAKGFGKNNDLQDPQTHALLNDMLAAWSRQSAEFVLQFNRQSKLHDINDCIEFGRIAMSRLSDTQSIGDHNLRVLIGDGTLDRHTQVPRERWATERYAFGFSS